MNVLKNFEAVFAVALSVAACASFALQARAPAVAAAQQPVAANIATPTRTAVVVVSAKRMSAAEKQRSLEDERRLARHGGAAGESS
jgi:hypothetical protein